jgi:multiple sugar transport system substrate-binding protein
MSTINASSEQNSMLIAPRGMYVNTRRWTRRKLIALGAMCVGEAALVACGETKIITQTKTVEVEKIIEVEKIVEVEIAPAAPASRKNVELRVAFWGTIEDTPTWQRGLDVLKGMHPHISYRWEDASWGDYWTKLNTMLAGGAPPDIIGMVTMYSQQYIRQGVLMPLTALSERDKNDNGDFWPANLIGYNDEAGETYGLPYDVSTICVYYNMDILEESGANIPEGRYTWDDFVEMVRKTSIIDGDKVERFGSDKLIGTGWSLDAHLRPNGASTLNKDGTKSALSDPKAVQVFRDWQQLAADRMLPTRYDKEQSPLFENGNMTFTASVPSRVQTYKERIGSPYGGGNFRWDVAYVPDRVQKGNSVAGGGFSGTLKAYENHPEETWEFLSAYTSSDVLRITIAEPGRGICGRQSCADAMLTSENCRHQEYFLDNLSYASQWCHPSYNEITAVQGRYLDRVVMEGEDPAILLAQADAEIDPIVEEGGAAILSGY